MKTQSWISAEQISRRVQALGAELTEYYGRLLKPEEPVFIVSVLKGAFVFTADLVRELKVPVHLEFVEVSSYGSGTESSGRLTWHKDLRESVEGRHVLILEDIVDTGLTMSQLLQELDSRKAASIKLVALLHKPSRSKVPVRLDHVGFTIEDKFVIGYGLDFNERYRELKDIQIVVNDR